MADPVTLFILVAAGERAELTRAMASATQDALGESGHVVVREVPGEPTDAQVLSTERTEGAGVVVELSWTDTRHQQASLRLHFASDRRWVERSIGFARSDADAERGRTLGFAIASILPQVPPVAAEAPPAGPAPTSSSNAEPTHAPKPAPAPTVTLEPSKPAEAAPSPRLRLRPGEAGDVPSVSPGSARPPGSVVPATTKKTELAVDVLAIGAMGIPQDASGLGGAAALQWFFARPLAIRLGAGLRGGDVGDAGSMLTGFGCGGVVFHPWRATLAHRFGASLRAEYLLLEESLTHFPPNGANPTVKQALVSGLGITADAAWRFAPDIELVVGGGVEDVFSPIYVNVQQRGAATIPPYRVVAEAGLRLDL